MAEILPLRRKTLFNQSIDVLKKTTKIMIMTGDRHVLVRKEKQNLLCKISAMYDLSFFAFSTSSLDIYPFTYTLILL